MRINFGLDDYTYFGDNYKYSLSCQFADYVVISGKLVESRFIIRDTRGKWLGTWTGAGGTATLV